MLEVSTRAECYSAVLKQLPRAAGPVAHPAKTPGHWKKIVISALELFAKIHILFTVAAFGGHGPLPALRWKLI
jgi:hypothetical protein